MRVKLEEVCKRIYAGGDVPKDRYSEVKTEEYSVPIYANAEKDGGLYGYTDKAREEELSITIAARGTIGFTAIRREPFLPVVRLITVVPDTDKVSERYLYYVLCNCKTQSSGTSIPQLTVPDIKKNSLELYSIAEQEYIADQLDKVNRIIELRQKELDVLDNLIKARFVEMFGDENNSKNWDVVNVEEVADVQVGVVIKPSQYYTDKSEGVRTFRSLNIGAGFIKDIDWVYFTKEGHQKNSKSILKKDDLLIVRSGAPGTACVVTEDYAGCNAVDIIIAHPDCKKVNPYYLCTFTNMPHGKKQIDEGIGGAAQQHFNVGKYNKLQLMLPPKTLQDEFVGFVKQVNKSKVVVSNTLYYN